jgi:hypothetical protein
MRGTLGTCPRDARVACNPFWEEPAVSRSLSLVVAATSLLVAAAGDARAQSIAAPFADNYTFLDLGTPVGVPAALGGLVIRADDPNTLLIGGAANSANAKIYKVDLLRGEDNHIIGMSAKRPAVLASAQGTTSGIDGGLDVGPNGTLFYTTYSSNEIGQIKPGSTGPDLLTALTPLGVAGSVGSLAFVPPGFPSAGALKIVSYNASTWYSTSIAANPNGTYAIAPQSLARPLGGGGPEGILFVEGGNVEFPVNSVLVCYYGLGKVVAYELDANSDPILATARDFMTSVAGAEGAARDPLTGDFLFSTFQGGNRVLVVRGFEISCPADLNDDGLVDAADLGILLGAWGTTGSSADLNADGAVNGADLSVILGAWGPCA